MEQLFQLKDYFPSIRERKEILAEIRADQNLLQLFENWTQEQQNEFLDYCCGNRGMRILYDSFFKESLNVEYDPARLEDLLSALLRKKVRIINILPNDSTRISDESALLITDIVVELEDGTLANIEIQKVGYMFPGARCACYSSDLLLRQYKRIRDKQKKNFSYKNIRNVYLIVLFEKSPKEFKAHPDEYYHYGKVVFNTGLDMDMLQEYVMIPLDIFRKCMQNKNIETRLEAWLTFLSEDRPEKIIELISAYPQFKAMYQTLYDMCLNTERMMQMFSKELRELDRNTEKYMIEELQRENDEAKAQLKEERRQWQEERKQLQEEQSVLQKELASLQTERRKFLESQHQLQEEHHQLQSLLAQLQQELTQLKKSQNSDASQ